MSGTRRKPGGLGSQVEGYRAWLSAAGIHGPSTVRNMLKELGQVGRWLTVQELEAAQLDEQRIAAFIAARRGAGYRRVPGPRAMVPLLSYLREVGIVAEAPPLATPLGVLLAQYRVWLVDERGLAAEHRAAL